MQMFLKPLIIISFIQTTSTHINIHLKVNSLSYSIQAPSKSPQTPIPKINNWKTIDLQKAHLTYKARLTAKSRNEHAWLKLTLVQAELTSMNIQILNYLNQNDLITKKSLKSKIDLRDSVFFGEVTREAHEFEDIKQDTGNNDACFEDFYRSKFGEVEKGESFKKLTRSFEIVDSGLSKSGLKMSMNVTMYLIRSEDERKSLESFLRSKWLSSVQLEDKKVESLQVSKDTGANLI